MAARNTYASSQPHHLFTRVRDTHARCTDQFESLAQLSFTFAQRPWREEAERLRSWGRNLYAVGDGRRTLEDHLREAGALGRALMQTLEAIDRELTKCSDSIQAPSFKIAGIDVLTTGEEASPNRNDEETRRLYDVATAITNLYVLYNVPVQPHAAGQYAPGPRLRRSFSNREDPLDGEEMIASTVNSPMVHDARSKRARRYSQSSSLADTAPYYRSPLTYGDTASSESLNQRMQGMSPILAGPPMNHHHEPQQPQRKPNGPKFMPIYTPQHLPHHPHQGPPMGVPKIPPASRGTHRSPENESRQTHEPGLRVEDFASDNEDGPDRGPRRLSRLSIPSDTGDDPNSANQTPKLTKTGRVSKALRGEPVHACNVCDKVYTRAEHLRRHRANHRVNLMKPER